MPVERVFNVLFLCTGNSARSILGEALLNHLGKGRFRAFSAGSAPKGQVHPLSLAVLRDASIPTDGLRSKSWDEFAGPDAPRMDFVLTVCDDAAGEACPIWPGRPATVHWGISDPAAVIGSDATRRQAFDDVLRSMRTRISAFTALPLGELEASALAAKLREIDSMEGSTQR